MDTRLLSLLKTKRLGRWCKLGAWAVLGCGVLQTVFIGINAWQMYTVELQLINDNAGIQPSRPGYSVMLPYLANACQGAVLAITGFTILFVAGTIFTSLATSTAPQQDKTDDIVYEPLNKPVKLRKGSNV